MTEDCTELQKEHHLLVCAVWDWIISVNNGHGLDAQDLMQALEELGVPCPDNLKEED